MDKKFEIPNNNKDLKIDIEKNKRKYREKKRGRKENKERAKKFKWYEVFSKSIKNILLSGKGYPQDLNLK